MKLDALLTQVQELKGQDVNQVKQFILDGQKHTFIRDEFQRSMLDAIVDVICNCIQISDPTSFAAQISESVLNYKKCSEKQSYHLANAIVNCREIGFSEYVQHISK